jgi:2-C-methyl-D-erythritol 2,4-cyclodiphosphate synthase
LDGHSDADVLLHAICDSLLGAAGLPDIGNLFPNTDPDYSGIDSAKLLANVGGRLSDLGYRVVNIDATLIAEAPKIGPHVNEMRSVISNCLGVEPGQIGIKATTNEGIGAIGQGEGIAAHAVACILRR